jgi:hypothetical protein
VTTPPPAVSRPPATASSPLSALKSGDLDGAANQWKKTLLPKKTSFTIQIEIACQPGTVMEAFQILNDAPELMVVPLDYKGRACYRVLYGVYSSSETAQRSRSKLPQEFLKQESPAQVIPLSKALK